MVDSSARSRYDSSVGNCKANNTKETSDATVGEETITAKENFFLSRQD